MDMIAGRTTIVTKATPPIQWITDRTCTARATVTSSMTRAFLSGALGPVGRCAATGRGFGILGVVAQRPGKHLAQAGGAGIGCTLERVHEREPVLVVGEGGKAARRAHGIERRTFAEAAPSRLDLDQQRQVAERDQGLGGEGFVVELL